MIKQIQLQMPTNYKDKAQYLSNDSMDSWLSRVNFEPVRRFSTNTYYRRSPVSVLVIIDNKAIEHEYCFDFDSFELLSKIKWCAGNPYATNSKVGPMHKYLFNIPIGTPHYIHVHHIDQNPKNNTYMNLMAVHRSLHAQLHKSLIIEG